MWRQCARTPEKPVGPAGWVPGPESTLGFSRIPRTLRRMLIEQVEVHLKPGCVASFRMVEAENARHRHTEPGVVRVDVVQHRDDPTRFPLSEVYRDADATARHQETSHCQAWLGSVADMMVEPRLCVISGSVFPDY